MTRARQLGLVLGGALAFGLVGAWTRSAASGSWDTAAQARATLANVSAPWLLVAFLAGGGCRRLRSGALLGLIATLAALGAFYLLSTLLEDLGGHGFAGDLRLELGANRGYVEAGLVSGPLFGAVGAWWRQRRSFRASLVAGALMMGEPIVLSVLGILHEGVLPARTGLPLGLRLIPGWGLTSQSGAVTLSIYGVEFAAGFLLVALALRRRAANA